MVRLTGAVISTPAKKYVRSLAARLIWNARGFFSVIWSALACCGVYSRGLADRVQAPILAPGRQGWHHGGTGLDPGADLLPGAARDQLKAHRRAGKPLERPARRPA